MSKIVRKTSKEIESMRSRGEIMTDSERVSHLSEESVERMAMDDPENFLKTDEDWAQAIIHRPDIRGPQKAPTKKSIAIRVRWISDLQAAKIQPFNLTPKSVLWYPFAL